ncbi:MAG TPA: DnaJ domain-containing protein, partial [Kouleothrix sp.]|nr:DnaJ domain-containing protein [Kouleothrix sp.]
MSDFEHLDYYELLGVSRSASFDEIKRAYRREISKFHPDRFVNAPPDDQAYASERSQRLTEAYAILSDFAARNAYNRGQPAERGARPPRPSTPPQQRDYQAELYDQAISHLGAGRQLQAIGALRQLQQINPFYRNSAELLAQIEAQLNHREERPPRRFRPLVIAGTITGGIVLVALAAWAIGFGRSTLASRLPASSGSSSGRRCWR